MKGRTLVAFLFLACSYCHELSILRQAELQQEELYKTGQIERFVIKQGKDRMLIYPGGPPVQGYKAVVEYFEALRTKGIFRYNSTTIEEMDLGDHALQITSVKAYNDKGTFRDSGTNLQFYKKVNGKPILLVDAFVSNLTPWPPVTKASARDNDITAKCC